RYLEHGGDGRRLLAGSGNQVWGTAGSGSFEHAQSTDAAIDEGADGPDGWLRVELWTADQLAFGSNASLRLPNPGEVRLRVSWWPWLSPTVQCHGFARRHGGWHRRYPIQVCGAPGNSGLYRRKLHAMHGVHHGLPGHRVAQHLAGCGDGPQNRGFLLRY